MKIHYNSKMLYWCLIPRFGQKFLTLSDSSKERIFFLISHLKWWATQEINKLRAQCGQLYRVQKDNLSKYGLSVLKITSNTLIHPTWSVLHFDTDWLHPFLLGVYSSWHLLNCDVQNHLGSLLFVIWVMFY